MAMPIRVLLIQSEIVAQQQNIVTLEVLGFAVTVVNLPIDALNLIIGGVAPFSLVLIDIHIHSTNVLGGILATQTLRILDVDCMMVGLSYNGMNEVDFMNSMLDHFYGGLVIDVLSTTALRNQLIRERDTRDAIGLREDAFNVLVVDNDWLIERLFVRLGCNTITSFHEEAALGLINDQPGLYDLHVISIDASVVINALRNAGSVWIQMLNSFRDRPLRIEALNFLVQITRTHNNLD